LGPWNDLKQAEKAGEEPLAFGVVLLAMLLHNSACRHFLGPPPVAAGALSALLDVLVLSLFFLADSPQVLLSDMSTS